MDYTSMAEQHAQSAEVFEAVHAKVLRFFPDLVYELGGDPKFLMARSGIEFHDASDANFGATYRQVIALIELAARELHCGDFGMRLATLQGGGNMFGPLGLVMRNSQTFGDALRYVGGHTYAHSLAVRVWLRPHRRERTLFAGHDVLLDGLPDKSQATEQMLLLGHLAAMEITGGRARVRKVHVRHQPVSSPKTYRRYFGCEVRFGQHEDGVFFSEKDLAAPIVDSDPRVYERAASFIDARFALHRPPLEAQVRGFIMQSLGTEDCRNERTAAELNLHPKTMQRMLKAEGTSFQKIKDDVRRDILLYCLKQTDMDLASISERLGFTEQSVMTRTCHRWFCASPTKLRAESRLPRAAR